MEDTEDFFPALDEKELNDNSMKLISVDGVPILLVKVSGKIFAIDNRCPHQGCGFSGGTLDGSVIVCPCHDWRFDLESGEYEEEPTMKLVKYEWIVKEGRIWVKLE